MIKKLYLWSSGIKGTLFTRYFNRRVLQIAQPCYQYSGTFKGIFLKYCFTNSQPFSKR